MSGDHGPGVRRLCVVVDLEAYSRHPNLVQIDLQKRLRAVLDRGVARLGTRRRVARQDRGDGQLIVLPPGLDEARAVPALLRGILVALEDDRVTSADAPRLRMRVALGQGIVHRASVGYVGVVIIDVCRLLDSDPVRVELRDVIDADMCLVVTDDLYRDVIVQGYGGFPGDGFRQVRVELPGKGFAATAWMRALTAAALNPDPMVVGAVAAGATFPFAPLFMGLGHATQETLSAPDEMPDLPSVDPSQDSGGHPAVDHADDRGPLDRAAHHHEELAHHEDLVHHGDDTVDHLDGHHDVTGWV